MSSIVQTALSQLRQTSNGERFALLLFALVCFQALFQQPYFILTRSVGMNLCTGALSLAAMAAAFLFTPGLNQRLRSKTVALSLALLGLVVASGLHSHAPVAATLRGLSLWSTMFGGYWCARLLLATEERRRLFVLYCLLLMAGFQALSLAGLFLEGTVHAFFDKYRHAQVSMWFLLAFAPLCLIFQRNRRGELVGGVLLAVAAGILFFSGLRTALLLPVLLGGAGIMLGRMRLRWFALLALVCFGLLALFFLLFPSKRLDLSHESLYYRAENYPFSLSIVAEHPFLGVGVAVPRLRYLQGYELRYPFTTREKFRHELKRIDSSENVLLTFACGLGLPFTLLYCGWAGLLLARHYQATRQRRTLEGIPALAVFLPLIAGVGHFMLYDGLLQPQVSWYFHLLLGLAPLGASDTPS